MFKVILKAEDGEYVLSEHTTYRGAYQAAENVEPQYSYPEQQLEIREECINLNFGGFYDQVL